MPAGWRIETLSAVVDLNPRQWTSPAAAHDSVSFVPMAAVEADTGRLDTSTSRTASDVSKGYTRFQDGDVLFAKITPCMENGKCAVARNLIGGRGAGSTEFHVLRPGASLSADFLFYYVLQDSFRRVARSHMKGTAGQLRVPEQFLRDVELPLPPPNEQDRIVAEIEKQFTRIDAATAILRAAQTKLATHRAAVLAAACRGAYDGGTNGPEADRTSQQVLRAFVLKERDRQLQGAGRRKGPVPPDRLNAPTPPPGWTLLSLDELTIQITSGSRNWSKFYGAGGDTFVLAKNIRPMSLELKDPQLIAAPQNDAEAARTRIQRDDLLVTIVGANTGDVCRVPHDFSNHFVCQSVALLRPAIPASARFLELYLASPNDGQSQWRRNIYGQGRPHLSFDQLRVTAIPFPPLSEQERIVIETEQRLSAVSAMQADLARCVAKAAALRRAVLRSAFDGRLPFGEQ